jgi:hypothetical protein
MSTEKSNDLIRNRSRDLEACSIVLHQLRYRVPPFALVTYPICVDTLLVVFVDYCCVTLSVFYSFHFYMFRPYTYDHQGYTRLLHGTIFLRDLSSAI